MSLPQNRPLHIKDFDGYIHFSQNTLGRVGRPVKIHVDVFLDFYCAVDTGSQSGQTVIRDIENLRTHPVAPPQASVHKPILGSAKHVQVVQKLNERMRQMNLQREGTLVTKNVQAFYRVFQKEGDKCPTVYVSEIKVLRGALAEALGFYQQSDSGLGVTVKKMPNRKLDNRSVFISGVRESAKSAHREGQILTDNPDPVLFFSPPSAAEDLGCWKTNRISETTQQAISELQQGLRENQRSKVSWLASGEGAAILSKALDGFSGSLEGHSFKLHNAKTNSPYLLEQLSKVKAKLDGEFFQYTGDRAALTAIAAQVEGLKKQIGILPGNVGYNITTRRYLVGQIEALAKIAMTPISTQAGLRGTSQTFIDALIKAKSGVR